MLASFAFDLNQQEGLNGYLAAGDEVGRGTLAGPVVVCLVLMDYKKPFHPDIKDSKKLSPKKRNDLASWIKENAFEYALAEVDNRIIDEINILEATKLAFYNAYKNLKLSPSLILLDALKIEKIPILQRSFIKGDNLSYGIACASILAKVHRDELMLKYHEIHPEYGFDKHKGYGTQAHLETIKIHGVCSIHRKSFKPCKNY